MDDEEDLADALAYIARLVKGDPFSTGPAPARFNELCASSPDFAAKVKSHAESQQRSSAAMDPLGLPDDGRAYGSPARDAAAGTGGPDSEETEWEL